MNIKEQLKEILCEAMFFKPEHLDLTDKHADQILDLVLNALIIEKVSPDFPSSWHRENANGYNECIEAYEKLKNKLRM